MEGLCVKNGECVYIIGLNGVGKLILLFIFVGFIDVDEGIVMLLGKLMNDWLLVIFVSVCILLV